MANFPSPLCCLQLLIVMIFITKQCYCAKVFDVISFGAKPDGVKDASEAFMAAWSAACGSSDAATILVPKGSYLLHPISFKGPCKSSSISFMLDGATVLAPLDDYKILGAADNWLGFEGVKGVSIVGGTLDANGASLWECKSKGRNCPAGATTLSFVNSNDITVQGLLSLNSQMFHIVFNGCNNVHVEGVNVIAPEESPNTDGIHVQKSNNVAILSSSIRTGDDCISIGPGTKDLWIERLACGPGHGISIGSLAKELEEEGVENVTVKTTVFEATQNGLRIKSWARPSKGFVRGVRFIDSLMRNVQNPIIIDQNYCPNNENCPNQDSGVEISDVVYQNIRGTSSTKVAIKFDCSIKNPCKGIRLENVKLTFSNQVALSSCSNAIGKEFGLVRPSSCL